MSMDVHIKGLRPVTDEYKKRLNIYKLCNDINIEPPEELLEYFEYEIYPCEDGMVVDLPGDLISHSTDMNYCAEYYDIDITKLPAGVTKVRFEMLY